MSQLKDPEDRDEVKRRWITSREGLILFKNLSDQAYRLALQCGGGFTIHLGNHLSFQTLVLRVLSW